jgi:hypothetical protein
MRPSRISFAVLSSAALITVLRTDASAQSYGPLDQVLSIGSAEFQPRMPPGGTIESDGYLYFTGPQDYYLAPVSIPLGAYVNRFCLYAYDIDPDHSFETGLIAVRLVPGGGSPTVRFLSPGAVTGFGPNDGYRGFCASVGYDHRGKIDMDGDGVPDEVAYYVYAHIPNPNPLSPLGLGGVRITFRREVSVPESQTFTDVPTTDPAFREIEALAASGITAGCAGGNYCPDASLTRRQMAVFLAKALGLHWTDETP